MTHLFPRGEPPQNWRQFIRVLAQWQWTPPTPTRPRYYRAPVAMAGSLLGTVLGWR
jgi:hypothetical protein